MTLLHFNSLVYQSWLQKFSHLFYGKGWQEVSLWEESQERSILMIMKQTLSSIYFFFAGNISVPYYFLRLLKLIGLLNNKVSGDDGPKLN